LRAVGRAVGNSTCVFLIVAGTLNLSYGRNSLSDIAIRLAIMAVSGYLLYGMIKRTVREMRKYSEYHNQY
jgi:hypothetical protein